MSKPPSPKQRHREGVLAMYGADCYAGPHGCSGRVQAAHWISIQRLTIKRRNAAIAQGGRGFYRPPETDAILSVPLDDLIADPRNGIPLCELHHLRFDQFGLHLQPPAEVIAFANDYGLEHLLGPATEREEALDG